MKAPLSIVHPSVSLLRDTPFHILMPASQQFGELQNSFRGIFNSEIKYGLFSFSFFL